jgi:hypothetical protein
MQAPAAAPKAFGPRFSTSAPRRGKSTQPWVFSLVENPGLSSAVPLGQAFVPSLQDPTSPYARHAGAPNPKREW